MENRDNKTAARAFAAEFARALGTAMSQLTGKAWPFQVIPAMPMQRNQPIHFRLTVEGRLRGECFVEVYEPQASEMAAAISELPSGGGGLAAQLECVLDAAIRALQAELAAQYGALTFKIERVTGLTFGGMFVVPLGLAASSAEPSVLLYFDGRILAALSGLAWNEQDSRSAFDPANLKLLMDVELNVSLRFGQRRLSLREVLELSSGSVIELDRMVDEPVELLLNGRVIARGEAVIVDDNYGLRVTEIAEALPDHLLK